MLTRENARNLTMLADEHPTEQREVRRSHATLGRESRLLKAKKIEKLLRAETTLDGATIVEVGAGAGFIASYFGQQVGPAGKVWAVDVQDQRQETSEFDFRLVRGTALPFEADCFDGAISNHVIEHVGSRQQQIEHLREIHRVLRTNGWLYLATPNRWGPIEPHYRLPLLSAMPEWLQSRYVRLAGRGTRYDCRLLDRHEICNILMSTGWQFHEITVQALRTTVEIERPGLLVKTVAALPDAVLRLILAVSPTLVFFARKQG